MSILQASLSFLIEVRSPWQSDWVWGCPLIVITVIIHVLGLQSIGHKVIALYNSLERRGRATLGSVSAIGAATLLATILHAMEASMWAATYRLLGALPDSRSAMLYSLGALTTYGHQSVFLEAPWRLLGTIEALNGWLLFGLSTAFLFWLMQEVSPKNEAGN